MPAEATATQNVKSEDSRRTLLVTIITLMVGLAGTAFGAILQGRFNAQLERQKFESTLIEKALNTDDQSEAARRLLFLLDTGVIQSLDGNKIRNKAEKQPAQLPVLVEGTPWYAVLASLPLNEALARKKANELLAIARRLGFSQEIQLYKTQISNNYAVVIGGQMTKSDALALAAAARQKALAFDAFAQQDRSWTLMGTFN